MKNINKEYNSSKTCQVLNGACAGLESTTEDLIDRIHLLSVKIASYCCEKNSIQKTNKVR